MQRLVWISGREIGTDLASTTEMCICEVLGGSGIETSLISPGEADSSNFDHIRVGKWGFPGLNTISGARNIRKMMRRGGGFPKGYEVLMVDWRYVFSLRKELKELSAPWIIVDRGPPAYLGILNRLQKIFWLQAWKIADEFAIGGLVVSKEHQKFIAERAGVGLETRILPAGCFPNESMGTKEDPRKELLLAYVGRIDRRRGLGEIVTLSEFLNESEICHRIYIAGEGDMMRAMEIQAKDNDNFHFLGNLDRNEVAGLLAKCHIGIMPMPDIPIWRISSPLKLSEYLASGLAIIGPSHSGNRLTGVEKWDLLSTDEKWAEQAVSKIRKSLDGNWEELVASATESSKGLNWDKITDKLIGDLVSLCRT